MNTLLARFPSIGTGWRVIPIDVQAGFSGARLWRVVAGEGIYCLKRWPVEHPSLERLQFIHAVLHHVARQGIDVIAVPIPDQSGQTIVQHEGSLWELSNWMPGEADFALRPSAEKLSAAMTTLGVFHLAASTYCAAIHEPSRGLRERCEQVDQLRRGELSHLAAAIEDRDWPAFAQVARQFVRLVPQVVEPLLRRLVGASSWTVAQQPCIRDIWHDHVLYSGDRVTGIVDFGAMRMENVAGDIARLAGSLVADDKPRRLEALAAYEIRRPLSLAERNLVEIFDDSLIVLGGLNWIRWIYLERRSFSQRDRVEQRLRTLLGRLRSLAGRS